MIAVMLGGVRKNVLLTKHKKNGGSKGASKLGHSG